MDFAITSAGNIDAKISAIDFNLSFHLEYTAGQF